MTRSEWLEVVYWLEERFPKPWTREQAEVYYEDLRIFDFGLIKEAVHSLYAKGLRRAPNGSEILAVVRESAVSRESNVKLDFETCRHLPLDDEGYCTACGHWPLLGLSYTDAENALPLDQVSAKTREDREMLPTVTAPPPEVPY